MKLYSIASILSIILILAACSSSVESDLQGEWKADDITITANGNFSKANEDALRRMEKSVSFVFSEDHSMQALTGGTSIDGTWTFNEETGEIFVDFIGDADQEAKLFGTLTKGKITSSRETGEVNITTVYIKK